MDSVFPIGFPPATIIYLVLYVVTWVIHVIFMNYVLAGTGYLAVVSLFTGGTLQRQRSPMALILRDWMPFMLSAAITAGVAPLLFVQILYQHRFYTANLLGSHRWMSILPVLIVAFYLCYVFKSKKIGAWSVVLRLAVGVVSFLLFLYIGYSWTANHLVSISSASAWNTAYAESTSGYELVQMAPRLTFWVISAVPTMILFASWQLWYQQKHGQPDAMLEARRCSTLALIGVLGTMSCGTWVYFSYENVTHIAIFGILASVYTVMFAAGLVIQIIAWIGLLRRGRFVTGWLTLATIGSAIGLIGLAVVRESIRMHLVNFTMLTSQHEIAFQVGGFPVFLAFFVICGGLCAWCFLIVRNNYVTPSEASSDAPA